MVAAQPQFLLFCDAHVSSSSSKAGFEKINGRWHFMLERLDGPERLEVTDSERAQPPDRLALLAVVRGLEALEQPSQVTLITTSRYVSRGLRYGLSEWREADYSWEHFGVQKPIRNADLWQRIDCAMQFHRVACRLLESSLAVAQPSEAKETAEAERFEAGKAQIEDAFESIQDRSDVRSERAEVQPSSRWENPARLAGRTGLAGRTSAERSENRSIGVSWWGFAAGWRHWWNGKAQRPTVLAGV